VSATVGGLSASTTYYFQIVAASATGSSAGAAGTVTTLAPVKPSPTISGTPAVGDTLTCNLGVTLPAGASATYAWTRDNTTIATATAATYLVAAADETHHLYCRATISGDGGTASSISAYVAVPSETIGTVAETVVRKASAVSRTVSTKITCSPQASTSCVITLRLTVNEAIVRGRAHLAASDREVAVGSSTTRIAPGATTKAAVQLNATGRQMLADKGRLTATLTVTGTVIGVINATLHKHAITFTKKAHDAPLRRS
jgi:hypothetical protein